MPHQTYQGMHIWPNITTIGGQFPEKSYVTVKWLAEANESVMLISVSDTIITIKHVISFKKIRMCSVSSTIDSALGSFWGILLNAIMVQ